jgi:hypothetical protein|tara:strand:+ start:215 stop:328 length:114 start_codon:yes stop_codon:yes gene_type:complete
MNQPPWFQVVPAATVKLYSIAFLYSVFEEVKGTVIRQ